MTAPFIPVLSSMFFRGPCRCKGMQGAMLLHGLCMAACCAEDVLHSVLNAVAGPLKLCALPACMGEIPNNPMHCYPHIPGRHCR